MDAILAHVVDEAFRLTAQRGGGERHVAQYGRIAQARALLRDACAWRRELNPAARQGPMCVGRTNGSWTGFLSDTRRAGEAHGVFRWQARARAAALRIITSRVLTPTQPQYESNEAWSGVQQTFLLVPKEARALRRCLGACGPR